MAPRKKRTDFGNWYASMRPTYQELARLVADTLGRLISGKAIDVVSVTSRAKEIDSTAEKVKRKGYRDPRAEMTDLAGVRVITFVESDVPRVADLVGEAFHVLPEKSSDRSEELGVDRSGYRSLHYVCTLGATRSRLPEFTAFRDLTFEIQIRTALQHAWAEIEHNRRYKFAGVLPPTLQRRLFLLAGMLEIADREFSAVAAEVDAYASQIVQAAQVGELSADINSPSLASYLEARCRGLARAGVAVESHGGIPAEVIDELRSFGAKTLADVDKLLSKEFFAALKAHKVKDNYLALLRDAMMFENLSKYLKVAWKHHWQGTDTRAYEMLGSKYGAAQVKKLFDKYEIDVVDEGEYAG